MSLLRSCTRMLASQSLFPSFFLSFSLCTRYGTSCKVPLGRRKDALNLCKHISRALFWVFTNFKLIFCLGENMSFLGKSLCSLHSVSFPFCGRASPVCSLSFPFSFLFHGTRALGTRSPRRQQLLERVRSQKRKGTHSFLGRVLAGEGALSMFSPLPPECVELFINSLSLAVVTYMPSGIGHLLNTSKVEGFFGVEKRSYRSSGYIQGWLTQGYSFSTRSKSSIFWTVCVIWLRPDMFFCSAGFWIVAENGIIWSVKGNGISAEIPRPRSFSRFWSLFFARRAWKNTWHSRKNTRMDWFTPSAINQFRKSREKTPIPLNWTISLDLNFVTPMNPG